MMKQLLANVQQVQEDVTELQHSNSKWKYLGTQFSQITATLNNLNDKGELSRQPIFQSEETLNVVTSKTVMLDELSIMDEYWSELEETLDVSLHEPDIIIAHNEKDEVEKEIEVISERPEEPQKESKEDQPLVLVKPPTLPCLPVKFKNGVVVKEHLQIFTLLTPLCQTIMMRQNHVLEVSDELLNLKEGMPTELPKAIDVPFIVKGEGIT
ncbi:hypothetical protein Sjap_010482 [Stephania japonica]|uniref:Uncharacterized protein n=1 Tax=Stephania japonica TaxID=461633 RepID=A0AAP0JAJ0_9MAGN